MIAIRIITACTAIMPECEISDFAICKVHDLCFREDVTEQNQNMCNKVMNTLTEQASLEFIILLETVEFIPSCCKHT